MANIEYSHNFAYEVEQSHYEPGFTVTQGSWTRETTDRVLPSSQQYVADDWKSLIYEDLPDHGRVTRVLRLEPGNFLDPLRGRLTVCTLADDGPSVKYVAFSYVWGDPSNRSGIIINERSIGIPTNLGRALRQIRSQEVAVSLWADAICINQRDIMERNQQVAIMLDIYSAATSVFAWLGPETQSTAVGMLVLKHLLEVNPGAGGRTPWELLPADLLVAGVADIAQRDYFKRMWVVQEAAVAAEVVLACGSHSISWKNHPSIVRQFERSVKLAGISPEWHQMGLADLDGILQLLQLQLETGPEAKTFERPKTSLGLLDVVYELRHRQVSDARDRYYALIGITERRDAVALIPDYRLSVEEVYSQVIKLVMMEESPEAGVHLSVKERRGSLVELYEPSAEMLNLGHTSQADLTKIRPSNARLSLESGTVNGSPDRHAGTANGHIDGEHVEEIAANNQGIAESEDVMNQRTLLISHLEATCNRAKALIASGQMRRAGTLLTVLARGVENGAEE
ncbi:hypothetical protein LTS16_001935 [Friedmanniomyces endolithicus]|nr:hypothetical protein LTR57_002141 [Friedmanniomyces endolithicus]KAK0987623.1 hypothetical protein LTS01_009541 [Friedmanniomyces endolithicus]KAK1052255.1 hypothetical protein LTS16_001935 [Friedmanniomyces endolithicus]